MKTRAKAKAVHKAQRAAKRKSRQINQRQRYLHSAGSVFSPRLGMDRLSLMKAYLNFYSKDK